jgi:hypothetical protein
LRGVAVDSEGKADAVRDGSHIERSLYVVYMARSWERNRPDARVRGRVRSHPGAVEDIPVLRIEGDHIRLWGRNVGRARAKATASGR